jgi:hypothetical protein
MFTNFITRETVVQLPSQQVFSLSINSPSNVNTYGFGFSLDYLLPNNFGISGNLSSDHIHNPNAALVTYFNTPDYRFNIGLNNTGFGYQKRFGFNIQYRWQDSYYTESDFRQGESSAFGTLDGQISYKLTGTHSLIKLGATNILDHYYITQYGNPAIGGVYYVSFGYNIF